MIRRSGRGERDRDVTTLCALRLQLVIPWGWKEVMCARAARRMVDPSCGTFLVSAEQVGALLRVQVRAR